MAVISVASAKGGCGKTTASILIAADLALEGYKVSLLDCDVNQHASAFGKKAEKLKVGIPNLTITGDINEQNILAQLKKADTESEIVFIDLPGGSSTLAIKALQRSNYVLVPAQASLPDVRDAMKTIEQIKDAEELAGKGIACSVLWTRFLPGFESKSAKHVRLSMEEHKLHILTSVMMERAAYREIHVTGKVPRQVDPKSAATENISVISIEILSQLKKIAGAKAA